MSDLVIVGGGVIGLSLAYEMSCRGGSVVVIDCKQPGQASLAGAGILIPANEVTAIHPLEKLRGLSSRLHADWAPRLHEESGIDNGYVECGGVYVARTPGEVAALRGVVKDWTDFEIEFHVLSKEGLLERVAPIAGLADDRLPVQAIWVENEAQIDNPFHLKALSIACSERGVAFVDASSVELQFDPTGIESVTADGQVFKGNAFCFAAGAWSEQLLQQVGFRMSMLPVRGQMVMYKLDERLFEPVLYEGSRYIVPRQDGHVLVGATIEEAGFDPSTTDKEIEALKSFAASLIPELDEKSYLRCWSGLRPGTYDGFPYMGRVPELANTYVSTGHFKAGLHLSTGSAVVMADLIEQQEPKFDLGPFDPGRALERT